MEQETLVQKIEQFSDDLTLLHRAVHGTETETVLLGGVATPSLRKMAADLDARESSAAQTAIAAGVGTVQAIADTAAQHVEDATQLAVAAATEQAERAKGFADAAEAVLPDALAQRVTDAETKNTQQDTRLDAVESGVTAISTTLIGSIQKILCTDSYVPNGCVPANGGEYTRAQFTALFDDYLVGGKLLTCTYTAWDTQVALTGNCGKFALDTTTQKFKVPLLKNGDSITQATSAAELGKSYKAGLPDVTGELPWWAGHDPNTTAITGIFKLSTAQKSNMLNLQGTALTTEYVKAALSYGNPIYGNSTTVTDEQVRLRHFVVVASAQNSASMFDWSAYMAALAGKANVDMSNATGNAFNFYLHVCDEKPSGTYGGSTSAATWQTRDLNTIRVNRIGASVANNRITIPAGRYFIRAKIPVYVGMNTRCALYNYTLGSYIMYSQSHFADYNYNVQHVVTLEGEFTLTTDTVIEIRMRVSCAYVYGMGMATGVSGVPEIYTEALIWKM